MTVPNPSAWPDFWLQAGPVLALCLALVVLSIVLGVRLHAARRRARAAAERDAAVEAARAARGLDRRSSRVRAVEQTVASITVAPAADETLL